MLNKSQTAMEFLILVGFLLLAFTVFFVFIHSSMSDKLREKRDIAIKEVALTIQNEIDLAFQSREGYQREFAIPPTIQGLEYEINITEQRMVYVRTKNKQFAMALPVQNITGDVIIGTNFIRKENGEVILNP
jgi:hypothetical protein